MPSTRRTIFAYIEDDLARHVECGETLPCRLTIAEIARHYEVSHMPVRVALGRLVARGVLEKHPSGRLAVGERRPALRSPSSRPRTRPIHPSAWQESLARDVVQESLRGRTDFLREEATAERYAVGRSVVRQVFGRMAGKGLLTYLPRRGWQIRAFDEREMLDYIQIRETLERKALRLARPRFERDMLEQMLLGNAPPRPGKAARLDNRLHQYFVERAGNAYIKDFFERHGVYYSTLFDLATVATSHVAEMARQHRAILRPLVEGRWSAAERALSRHIRAQEPMVRRMLEELRAGRVRE